MTITIRALRPDDLDVADAIVSAAYGIGSRRAQLELYLRLEPDGWALAALDGEPVGIGGATDYGAFAYIGLVGVVPQAQRRGVALAVMEHLLAWLRERGGPVVALNASAAGGPLYERLGFVDDGKTVEFAKDDCAALPAAADGVVPIQPADLPDLAAFDTPIFGAERARVFGCLLDDLPGRAFVRRGADGRLAGYLFAQRQTLGPWAARSEDVAAALLAAALRLDFDGPPRAFVPSENPDAASLLLRHGFSPRRALRYMRLGGAGPVGRRDLLYGLATLGIG